MELFSSNVYPQQTFSLTAGAQVISDIVFKASLSIFHGALYRPRLLQGVEWERLSSAHATPPTCLMHEYPFAKSSTPAEYNKKTSQTPMTSPTLLVVDLDRINSPICLCECAWVGCHVIVARTILRTRTAAEDRTSPVTTECGIKHDVLRSEVAVNGTRVSAVKCNDWCSPITSHWNAIGDIRGNSIAWKKPLKFPVRLGVSGGKLIAALTTYIPDDSHCIAYTPPPILLKLFP